MHIYVPCACVCVYAKVFQVIEFVCHPCMICMCLTSHPSVHTNSVHASDKAHVIHPLLVTSMMCMTVMVAMVVVVLMMCLCARGFVFVFRSIRCRQVNRWQMLQIASRYIRAQRTHVVCI